MLTVITKEALTEYYRVWVAGFEPATTRVQGEDSDQAELHPEENGQDYPVRPNGTIGTAGFEPAASPTPGECADQTALRSVNKIPQIGTARKENHSNYDHPWNRPPRVWVLSFELFLVHRSLAAGLLPSGPDPVAAKELETRWQK
jgi:hypothetical protein